jgi:hypothetical protein
MVVMPANGGRAWQQFTKLLKAGGWIREDMYYWKHPEGGRFYPFNTKGTIPQWRIWAGRGEAPPGDYEPFGGG